MKGLFDFLEIHHTCRKHCTYSISWGMVATMHNVILKHIMLLVQHAKFISITCDVVTTLDNQSWISIDVYIFENWCRVPILLNLEWIVNGGTSNNFIFVIILYLVIFGGILEIDIVNKVVCFGIGGVTVFQDLNTSVIVQLVNKHCPFVVGIHLWHIGVILLSRLYHLWHLLQRLNFFLFLM
jgi:hypothetical protein